MRSRWITIALIKSGVAGRVDRLEHLDAIFALWRGEPLVLQPVLFAGWPDLLASAQTRLGIANLSGVAFASRAARLPLVHPYRIELLALVCRLKSPRLWRGGFPLRTIISEPPPASVQTPSGAPAVPLAPGRTSVAGLR
jgi:hypothetical protein